MGKEYRVTTIKQLHHTYLESQKYIPSGFKDLDKVSKGFKRKEVTIIGGRPSSGKTSFGLALSSNLIESKFSVMYVTLELSAEQLFNRFNPQNLEKVNNSNSNSELFICDSASGFYDYSALENRIRKLYCEQRITLVIIDYFQLIVNKQTESRSIISKLKTLAKELNLAIVIFSQLSKDVDKRVNQTPLLKDLLHIDGNDENIDNVLLIRGNKSHKANKGSLSVTKHNNYQDDIISFEYDM